MRSRAMQPLYAPPRLHSHKEGTTVYQNIHTHSIKWVYILLDTCQNCNFWRRGNNGTYEEFIRRKQPQTRDHRQKFSRPEKLGLWISHATE
jgi:hypothetical protein